MKSNGTTADRAVTDAVERELRALGIELHDNLCQSLASSSMLLALALRQAQAGVPVSADSLERLSTALDLAISQTRALSRRLNPPPLAAAGLMKALADYAEQISFTVPCEFTCEKVIHVSDPDVALALFRVAQEAVADSIQQRKSHALSITLSSDDAFVRVSVRDYSNADRPVEAEKVMRHRARSVGGKLTVESLPGEGASVTFSVPV